MPRLSVFNQISLDGYFVDDNGDMSWAHNTRPDEQWEAYVAGNASGDSMLVFGRITYELMASYWPTPIAAQNAPLVAEKMNTAQKVVFSRTLGEPTWANTRVVAHDMAGEIRAMKSGSGPDMVIMGSGTIVSQLTQEGLIDRYQVVVVPIVVGSGRTMFAGVQRTLHLRLTGARSFVNGNAVLTYEPLA
jgi:dihydrofolate reductase